MSTKIHRSEVCSYVDERLPWLVGVSLEPAESFLLLRHLDGCEECRNRLSEEVMVQALSARHLPAEEIAAFGMDLPTILPAGDIEDHLRICKDCSVELECVRGPRPRLLARPYKWAATALLVLGAAYVGSQSLLSDAPPSEAKQEAAVLEGQVLDAQSLVLFGDSFESGTIGFWQRSKEPSSPS